MLRRWLRLLYDSRYLQLVRFTLCSGGDGGGGGGGNLTSELDSLRALARDQKAQILYLKEQYEYAARQQRCVALISRCEQSFGSRYARQRDDSGARARADQRVQGAAQGEQSQGAPAAEGDPESQNELGSGDCQSGAYEAVCLRACQVDRQNIIINDLQRENESLREQISALSVRDT